MKIENIAPLQRGFDLPSQNIVNGNIPIVYSNGILKFHNEFKCKAPGLVTGRSGTIGKFTFLEEGEYWPHNTSLWVTNFFKNDPKFIYYLYHTINIENFSTGSGVPTLNRNDVHNKICSIPTTEEQQKISLFLSLLDERIQTQKKIIEGLITLKIQSRNKLFTQITKGNYETFTVEEILKYEQPTKYIVSNTDYSSDTSLIPVLTANKAFILGYTDEDWGIYNKGKCIVLDDFTMDLKYVDFPFKVKSSAIKLLTPKINVNLKFIFEYFSFLNLSSNEHKRHYISEIQPMFLNVPPIEIQNNISNLLSKLDAKVNLETELLTQYENQKKYLLKNLFV